MNFQSALNPAGAHAHTIWELLWWFVIPFAIIFIIVMTVALLSISRRHRSAELDPLGTTHRPPRASENRLSRIVGGATILTVLILLGLIVASVSAGKSISVWSMPRDPLVVEVTGSQWWWKVRYMNDDPSRVFVTANEIHIPVGRQILMRGTSADVIHSFWVPNLQGKRDLIPSRITTELFEADRPGRYRGQCAEFCGFQHAHMALWVVAEPEDRFESWMNAQLRPAADPSTPSEQRGKQVFMEHACVLCHTISGTEANGTVAPDLTHLASRLTIAAGTLENNRGNLGGWITDPQRVKPGNNMATVPIHSDDLPALLDYLESLK